MSTIASGTYDQALKFDGTAFETLSVTVDGKPLEVRRYEVVYVGRPIEMAPVQPSRGIPPSGDPDSGEGMPLSDPLAYQKMIVYVPQPSYESRDTAIILHVTNSGWFASAASEKIEANGSYSTTSDDDPIGKALGAGYVIVVAGTRSRGALAVDGRFAGKSPAAVVDAKAAIRYLRLNDDLMPGSAERIVITGTSGGGALSAIVAASGNSPDYLPYLAEIGAAGVANDGTSTLRDDVFATIAYCPITDLGNADIAYEWQFNAVRSEANTTRGDYSEAARNASAGLAEAYPAYLESLRLKTEDGMPLNTETMKEAIVTAVRREAETMVASGTRVPALGESFSLTNRGQTMQVANDWLEMAEGKVHRIDYENFLRFVTTTSQLKIVPALDTTANTDHQGLRGENSLFGGGEVPYSNFTDYGWSNNQVAGDGSGADDTGMDWATASVDGSNLATQLRLINPLKFLNTDTDTAPNWYLRHGMIDRDTSFAVQLLLYLAVLNDPTVKNVSFKLTWMRPHSGNYDVQEAYGWLAARLTAAGQH
jgi:hypothetical protein